MFQDGPAGHHLAVSSVVPGPLHRVGFHEELPDSLGESGIVHAFDFPPYEFSYLHLCASPDTGFRRLDSALVAPAIDSRRRRAGRARGGERSASSVPAGQVRRGLRACAFVIRYCFSLLIIASTPLSIESAHFHFGLLFVIRAGL